VHNSYIDSRYVKIIGYCAAITAIIFVVFKMEKITKSLVCNLIFIICQQKFILPLVVADKYNVNTDLTQTTHFILRKIFTKKLFVSKMYYNTNV
jgi:hypothetical protein